MSTKTTTRGLATLIVIAVLVFGANIIMSDDDESGRRAVHFSAHWNDKQSGLIEYGVVTTRQFDESRSPWDADMLVSPGDRVRLHVQFRGMTGPSLLACWITVNDEVYSSKDDGQQHLTENGSCKVEAIVR